jgi:hypothetical protein
VLGRPQPRQALVTLVDRLVEADSPRRISADDVTEIGRRNGTDLPRDFRTELEHLYRDYLLYCFTDHQLSDDELADLAHLESIFQLEPATCDVIHRHVARQLYFKSVSEVLADGTISADERAFLQQLQQQLGLPAALAENISDVRERQVNSARRNPRKRPS